jgi:hypothetical protein
MSSAMIVAIWAAGAAVAHPEGVASGPRLGAGAGVPGDERNAVLASHEIARCLATKRRRTVEDLLAAADAAGAARAGARLAGEETCFDFEFGVYLAGGRKVFFSTDVVRGIFAEQLIERDQSRFLRLPQLPRQQVYRRPWFAATSRHSTVDEMATCVSEIAPAATLAVILTQPYSDAERHAFTALAPVMGPCLLAGAKLQANQLALRGALAEALYQRTRPWAAAPVATTAGAAR